MNGVEVAVPHISGGRNVLAALKPGADLEAVSAKLREAFGSPAGARAAALQPQAAALKPGDVLVLNDGDHGVFYLGGRLVFHKKSFLKDHIYRIVPLEQAYKPEPFEWRPSPFDGSSPFNDDAPIRDRKAWRPTGWKACATRPTRA